jgi:hypothetical protein
MLWFPALAIGATIAFAGKLVNRYRTGQLAHHAIVDPEGLCTVARFSLDGEPQDVLLAIAAELGSSVEGPLEITQDAVRTPPQSSRGRIDIVRLGHRGGRTYTLELTRAWTGISLDAGVRALLACIHHALASLQVLRDLAWFARHDRELTNPHTLPYVPAP